MKRAHLFFDGYQYSHDCVTKTGFTFRCTLRRSKHCTAVAKTNSNREDIVIVNTHTHPRDHHKEKRLQIQNAIKTEATTSRSAPSHIVNKHIAGVEAEVLADLPMKKSLFKSIQRKRPAPVDPSALSDFKDIEDRYKTTDLGEMFLQHDSGHEDPNRFLVFSTAPLLTLLAAALTFFCDGTLKIAPQCFQQVYVLRILSEGVYVTALYGLLPNKKKTTYKRVFKRINRLCNTEMAVKRVVMDLS